MEMLNSSEIWSSWDKGGKNEFTKACIQYLKEEAKSPVFDKNGKLTHITHSISTLIEKAIGGKIRKESAVLTLQELVVLHSDVPSIILDVLNIADAASSQVESSNEESKERAVFCFLVKECEKFLSDKLLKERLEIDTLQEVGILKNKTFYSKFIKVKTKLYYKQKKFNLFREECEGYAKLITELNKHVKDNRKHVDVLIIIQSLVGCFNLDPNRVLDVILESFENNPGNSHLFIPLIKCYTMKEQTKIITEILGSKYSFLRNNEFGVPQQLHILTATLLQNNIISLEDIYPWLTPDDRVMQKDVDKKMKDAKEYFRKLQIVSLNNKDKEETPEEPENLMEIYKNNQKLGLCQALLEIGDWTNAKILIEQLPDKYAMNFQPVALALCGLLHYIIEPVYRENCKLGPKIKGGTVAPNQNELFPKQCTNFQSLRDTAIPMLIILGPSLRFDTVLLSKLVRLSKAALTDCGVENAKSTPPNLNDSLYFDVLTLLDVTILPSLSYLDCNCCIAEEIWSLLKLFPYTNRYCLYSRWKNDTYSLYPDLLRKRGDSEKQIKNIMKRVSKENVKPVGRLIGKLTHCSPGFLFDYVLLQIQVYNNLIHPVVDSLKYLTSLSYDILGYCLVECLANADKKRVKHDSTNISTWLQSLSSFCGAVYKKYSIELTGLLQYVGNQLKAQKSLDLLILKEVVQKMAGIESAEDLTIDQLNAMAGGDLLKSEAGYSSQVRNTKKSSQRLKDAMADQDLAVTLCLLMAQQKYCVVYRETQKSHLKLVGKLSDQCQDALVQFGNFLGSTMTVDEYTQKLPSIESMLLDYHIPNEVAFFLARPMFNNAITIKYDQLRKADPNCKRKSEIKNQKYFEAASEIMTPIHKSVLTLHLPKVWEDISPQFLVTFWSLTMYDLFVPEETYGQIVSKLKMSALNALDSSSSKGKKEQEKYLALVEKLQDEKKKQSEHVEKVLYRLGKEKDSWFITKSMKSAKNETITRFLQLCLFPRCTFTAIDALFCAKFVHTIHTLKTPNFSTLLCYDRLFCDITYSVTSCTENEAMRYGRFLYAMLETVMRWHKSKTVFDRECANFPGFVTKYRVSNQHIDNTDQVGYENYRHVVHKWHFKLAKALVTCLESKDYIQIRNALIILIKIIQFFPVLIKLSQFIEKRIEKVRDEEKNNRQDLFTLSSSYLALLKQRISNGCMIKESDFHIPSEKVKNENRSDSSTITVSKYNGEKKDDKKEPIEIKDETPEDVKTISKVTSSPAPKEKSEKSEKPQKEESREKTRIKEEKRDDNGEKDRDRDKRRERKEEKQPKQEDYSRADYREDRYIEVKEERIREKERYFEERESRDRNIDSGSSSHYYRDNREDREREVSNLGNGSASGSGGRHSQESDPEREVKRRKMEGSTSKTSKHEEHKERKIQQQQQQQQQFEYPEKSDKKERAPKLKEKREKLSEEEKEIRKQERKLGRKRDRGDDPQQAELKRRREEEKAAKLLVHSNGDFVESPHVREKHHRSREISPLYQNRERSHDRIEGREKHSRRNPENKRR